AAGIGYTLESSPASQRGPFPTLSTSFSPFDPVNDQAYYVEVYNTGSQPLEYTLTAGNDWIKLSSQKGTVAYEERVYVSVDWDRAPNDPVEGEIVLSGAGRDFTIKVPI